MIGAASPLDLDDRDPDFIRERLPTLWLISNLYFRGDVRGLGNVPDEGPLLLVGNHSGGRMTPDTLVLVSAFSSYFGVERSIFAFTRAATISWPSSGWLRRFGIVPPAPGGIGHALRSGATVITYPGGDEEADRPSWRGGRVALGPSTEWVEEALDQNIPVVPVVTAGAQETALFLGRARGLSLPVSLGAPWGLNVGHLASPVPLPAKLTTEVLHPIDLRARYGPDPDPAAIRDDIAGEMQHTLSALHDARRLPVLG
ncbi:MAG: hypothetical protein JHC95_18460 [Solirubrobacteraceae bacterium]|nr:hypothetical protein [Solirubrobacteraceae bacterium]